MDKINTLKDFLINNFDSIHYGGSTGSQINFPNFEIYPRDFLKFARLELQNYNSEKSNLIHIINCVSHLKRALDCQFDLFLYQINLSQVTNKNNLKFNNKLEFLKNTGILESVTMSRLNYLRNKMEHQYKIPIIEDLESYYDLVAASISILESTAASIVNNYEISFESHLDDISNFTLRYSIEDNPYIIFYVKYINTLDDLEIKVTPNELEAFSYYLRAFLLMLSFEHRRPEFIMEELQYNIVIS